MRVHVIGDDASEQRCKAATDLICETIAATVANLETWTTLPAVAIELGLTGLEQGDVGKQKQLVRALRGCGRAALIPITQRFTCNYPGKQPPSRHQCGLLQETHREIRGFRRSGVSWFN